MLAPTITDPNDNDIKVAAHDDDIEEGRGFDLYLDPTAADIDFTWLSRGSLTGNVLPKLYYKKFPGDGAADPDASFTASGSAFAVLAMTADDRFHKDTENKTLAAIGLTADNFYNFEHTRDATAGTDTMVGDWLLKMLRITVNA